MTASPRSGLPSPPQSSSRHRRRHARAAEVGGDNDQGGRAVSRQSVCRSEGKAVLPFDSEDRLRWHFIPNEMFPRKGLMIKEAQRRLAHDLLRTA